LECRLIKQSILAILQPSVCGPTAAFIFFDRKENEAKETLFIAVAESAGIFGGFCLGSWESCFDVIFAVPGRVLAVGGDSAGLLSVFRLTTKNCSNGEKVKSN